MYVCIYIYMYIYICIYIYIHIYIYILFAGFQRSVRSLIGCKIGPQGPEREGKSVLPESRGRAEPHCTALQHCIPHLTEHWRYQRPVQITHGCYSQCLSVAVQSNVPAAQRIQGTSWGLVRPSGL